MAMFAIDLGSLQMLVDQALGELFRETMPAGMVQSKGSKTADFGSGSYKVETYELAVAGTVYTFGFAKVGGSTLVVSSETVLQDGSSYYIEFTRLIPR